MTGPTAEFGYTLWGRDFRLLVEPLRVTRPEPLLPRARTLARNAMRDVTVEDRLIRGTVVRGAEASVAHLEFGPMPRETATRVTAEFGGAPAAAAMTDDAHRAIEPAAPELVSVDCSCRARTERCVHVLALLYETVRRIDDDPVLALTLRGFPGVLGGAGPVDEAGPAPRLVPLASLDPDRFYG
ncbi:MAG: hypothetical protein QM809_07660 [Gordonia sp. (in: high G+C Gram-positive bacteria)]|uniref:hypothetical protein n=1 Tax=Gordonia sp. (in: high G+C Gram-positive bacteria) TaxID=84139 RepID=UPI0039E6D80E